MEPQGKVLIQNEGDMVSVRKTARQLANHVGFKITDVTRIVTAASELARNIFHYAGRGVMLWRMLNAKEHKTVGIELTFQDKGPGIADINQVLQEGYSSRNGLGMGLPGTKRLMDEMNIESEIGKGTTITVTKWKR